jgi:hypothetical protein
LPAIIAAIRIAVIRMTPAIDCCLISIPAFYWCVISKYTDYTKYRPIKARKKPYPAFDFNIRNEYKRILFPGLRDFRDFFVELWRALGVIKGTQERRWSYFEYKFM